MHKVQWIALTNTGIAKVYKYTLKERSLDLIEELNNEFARLKTSDIGADQPGRFQRTNTPREGSYAQPTDPKDIEAQRFAGRICNYLADRQADIETLTIFAPGHFQAMIKSQMSKPVADKIERFIDKDYTKLGIKDLEQQLATTLNLRF